ncbi:hypothetical protein KKB18_11225, partial [bacterium]|nr:hypothetical protein [bacterium]
PNKEDKDRFLQSHDRMKILNEISKEEETGIIPDKESSISIEKFDYMKKIDFDDDNAYISTLDGEKMFGVSRITIFRWIKDGKLNAVKGKNGRFKILLKDLKNYMTSQKTGRESSMLTLQKYLEQEEKRYLRTLLESGKRKEEITAILAISVKDLAKKIEDYNLKSNI